MENIYLAIVLAPLLGAVVAGLFGRVIGRTAAHRITIIGVGISSVLSLIAYKHIIFDGGETYNATAYIWLISGNIPFTVGFLIDELTVTMMVVVTIVSWLIHIYSIGYMHDDPGYQRFFSYISLFTFAMLMLVMSNNFLQLFFAWEGVGLVSYLLIGFWFKKETAIFANLKAFLVNRVGDFGFLLGIAAILTYFNSLDYATIFSQAPDFADAEITILGDNAWSLMSLICICLFIGAMGKSAQVPLHVWLPDSMEGPTPISALIHAATMVTAGIFMVARMSPLFEHSETALSLILIIGAVTALSMSVLGLVQNDIKRVIAYSTLSQLGYMTVALGASAYAAAIFHLVTHAFFKALLFLAAGAVIVMRHEKDMRKMGGLYKKMPITWITCFFGSLALIGFPGTAGFFSKDAIIEAVHLSSLPGATFAYYAVLAGVFFTALYSFRLFFMTFHGEEHIDIDEWKRLQEAPWTMTVPLIALALPSLIIGWFLITPMLFGDYFGNAIFVAENNNVLDRLALNYYGAFWFMLHAFTHPAVLGLMAAGIATAWLCYLRFPQTPRIIAERFTIIYQVLANNYGFDRFNQAVFPAGSRKIGNLLWTIGDIRIIDGLVVNGSARIVSRFSALIRHIQSGYLYHYAFSMIIGLLILLGIFLP